MIGIGNVLGSIEGFIQDSPLYILRGHRLYYIFLICLCSIPLLYLKNALYK